MRSDGRKRLVEENLHLVVLIAKRYPRREDYSFLDLVEAGKVGFMKAIESYVAPADQPRVSNAAKVTYMDMKDGSVFESNPDFESHAAPFIRAEMDRGIEHRTTATTRSAEDQQRIEELRALLDDD